MKDVDTIKYDDVFEIVEAVDWVMKTIEDDYNLQINHRKDK